MTPHAQSPSNSRQKGGFAGLCAACLLLLTGCASQGPLRPPSLHLPAPVRSLVAERIGDGVDLQWTSPTRTTDGQPLTGKHVPIPIRAEICRAEMTALPCQTVGRLTITGGEIERFHDALSGALAVGPPRGLTYRVCILNSAGRGAACSTVEALAGTAPEAAQRVAAALTHDGVLVRWQPVTGPSEEKILLRVTRGAAASQTGAVENKPTQENRLLSIASQGQDPGGALDTGAKPGIAQHYSITRIRTVHLGSQDLIMSGPPALVTVASDAKLPPPAPPAGLEAVVDTLGPLEINLVWQPGSGAAGYFIFRATGPGQPVLLTGEPVRQLTYTDKAVKPGVRYRYSIAAVDRDGVTGPKGAEITEQMPDR